MATKKNGAEIKLGKVTVVVRKKATQRGLKYYLRLKRLEQRAMKRAKILETKRKSLEKLFIAASEGRFGEDEPVKMTVMANVEKVNENDLRLEVIRGERSAISWKTQAISLAERLKYDVSGWIENLMDGAKKLTWGVKVY